MQGLTCPDCEGLKRRVEELELENSALRFENADLKRRLAFYENAHVAPSQRRFQAKMRKAPEGGRYPGSPKGHVGTTRLRLKPDVVKTPEVKDRCERCGAPLGEPSFVDMHAFRTSRRTRNRHVGGMHAYHACVHLV